ncbi:C-type lectin domain-containing protein [Gammaproteobacteria bacterium]
MLSKKYCFTAAILGFASAAQADSAKLVNPANNHAYQRFDTSLNWTAAKDACAGLGGYLATITSQAEQDWVIANLNPAGVNTWLGGSDAAQEGTWTWVTGEPWNYSNWNTGEPNNAGYGGGENYLHIVAGTGGHWNDVSENNPGITSYHCEWNAPSSTASEYLNVTAIPDVNGDGKNDNVTLSVKSNNFYIRTFDGANWKPLKSVTLGSTAKIKKPSGFTVVDDVNGNQYKEVALFFTKEDGIHMLQLRDSSTLAMVKNITLDSSLAPIDPISLTVEEDANANGSREIGILFGREDGTSAFSLLDGLTFKMVKTTKMPK